MTKRVFSLAEGDEHRNFQRLSVHHQTDHRRGAVLRLIVRRARSERRFELDDLIVNAEFLGGLRSDQRDVVPSELGNRIGSFLQPAVVDPAAVEDRRVSGENHFQRILGRRRSRRAARKHRHGEPDSQADRRSQPEIRRAEAFSKRSPLPRRWRRMSRARRCRRARPRLFHPRH